MLMQLVYICDQVDEHDDWRLLGTIEDLHEFGLALAVMRDKLNLLLDSLFVADLAHLDEGGELEVLPRHFLN